MKGISPRLRAPVLMMVFGTATAVVAGVGRGWAAMAGPEIITVIASIGYYVIGGRDGDFAAMIRSQPDERQRHLRLVAQAWAAQAMVITALICDLVMIALRDPTWPFYLVLGVGVAAFLGRLAYGIRGARVPSACPA